MPRFWLVGVLGWLLVGCRAGRPLVDPMGPPVPIFSDNPILIPLGDPQFVWEGLIHVLDDYFRIEREEPVRLVGDLWTEGRVETFPEIGSTVLEPWRYDSADLYERVESTLQSIRRRAEVRVIPVQGGCVVDVAVYKELEDVARPAHAAAGSATFRTEGSLARVVSPIEHQEATKGWIPLGRDRALEQRILAHLQERLGVRGVAPAEAAGWGGQPSIGPGAPQGVPAEPPSASGPPHCKFGARASSVIPEERVTYRIALPEDLPARPQGCSVNSPSPFGPMHLRSTWQEPLLECGTSESDNAESGCFVPSGEIESEGDQPTCGPFGERRCCPWRLELAQLLHDTASDYWQFYSPPGLLLLAGGIGGAAVLANTRLDEDFRQWHNEHVFTHDLSRFAYVMREFGSGPYWVPFYAVCAVAGPWCDASPALRTVGQWGNRSLRSFVVGAPAVLALQWVLGASRPGESAAGSRWIPFEDMNAVSGHAFIGGISFLNAAMLTDHLALKSAFVVASLLPGWCRVIQDKHYLSQALLGWWLAWLSVTAVEWTERWKSTWLVAPVAFEGGLGACLVHTW